MAQAKVTIQAVFGKGRQEGDHRGSLQLGNTTRRLFLSER